MKEMTKAQIRERKEAVWSEIDKMDEERMKRESQVFTKEEAEKYDALLRESNSLSARIKDMASDEELKQIRSNEEQGKQLREEIKRCFNERTAANTVLANAITTGDDQNATANLEAGGLIPVRIKDIIDTKVPGLDLPDSLKLVTGVTGTDIIPYSVDDVKFSVEGEVTKVAEQALNFANLKASPVRVAASLPVSYRAIDNADFDLVGFLTYKFQKGWRMFRALHIYAHGEYTKLQSPFATCPVVELTLDENIGKNLKKEIAKMFDLGFIENPEIIMDKETETDLEFTYKIPGSTTGPTVVQDGKVLGLNYKVSPLVDYAIASNGVATKDATYRYIAIGHFGYLAEQQHGQFRFNIDGTSQENFDRNSVAIGMSTDYSLTDLSKLVNGGDSNNPHKPQAFKLIKLVEPVSSSDL